MNFVTSISSNEYLGFSSSCANTHKFGFQGQEKNSDLTDVDGGHYDFKYRVHDTRLGRFLSVDPLTNEYAWNSPYSFSENKVIRYIELEGKEKLDPFTTFQYVPKIETETASEVFHRKTENTSVFYNNMYAKTINGPIMTWNGLVDYGDQFDYNGSHVLNDIMFNQLPGLEGWFTKTFFTKESWQKSYERYKHIFSIEGFKEIDQALAQPETWEDIVSFAAQVFLTRKLSRTRLANKASSTTTTTTTTTSATTTTATATSVAKSEGILGFRSLGAAARNFKNVK